MEALTTAGMPKIESDVSWVVLLVLYLVHVFVVKPMQDRRAGQKLSGATPVGPKQAANHAATPEVPAVCPGLAACPHLVSSKARISDAVLTSALNSMALGTNADSAVLLVAENGSGIPRPGKRAYTTVVKQITLRGEVAPSWVSVQVTNAYIDQILTPVCNKGAIVVRSSVIEDITLRDRFNAAVPPTTDALVLLLDTRTTGLWYISLHFSEDSKGPPEFTSELRSMLRNHGNALISALPGKKTEEDYHGIGSPLCRWGE